MKGAILKNSEQRTVQVRTAEIQNQCTILSNQIMNSDYLKNTKSEVINTELSPVSYTHLAVVSSPPEYAKITFSFIVYMPPVKLRS